MWGLNGLLRGVGERDGVPRLGAPREVPSWGRSLLSRWEGRSGFDYRYPRCSDVRCGGQLQLAHAFGAGAPAW